MEKDLGRDTMTDYMLFHKYDRTLEHSIGYDVIKRDEKDQRKIAEYKLWEISTLTGWGANENTPMVEIKSKQDIIDNIKLVESMFQYEFKYSSERLKQAEKYIKELESLLITEPVDDHSLKEPIELATFIKSKLTNFNL